MEAIGDHQLDSVFLRCIDHRLAFFLGYRHGLFTKNVHMRLRSANGVLTMQMVWQSQIDCVHLGERTLIVIIGIHVLEPILPAQFFALFGVSRDNRRQFGVVCRFKCRQDRDLRDVPQPYDCVANLVC